MPKGQESLIHYFKSLIIALLLKVNSQKALLFEQVKSQLSEDDLKHEKAVNSVRANSTTTQIKFDHPLRKIR